MRTLLSMIICILAIAVTFSLDMSLGGGLSVTNVFMYLAAMVLIFQAILGKPLTGEIRGLHVCFGVLIGYAILTTLIAANMSNYRDYGVVGNLIVLKSTIFDWWVLFAIFYYGARSVEDVEKLIKLLLIVVSLANVATIGQLSGIVNLHRAVVGEKPDEDRRIFGVFGHANETGTLIACLIPAYMAVADSAFGVRRWLWIGGMMSSVTVLILTASRGALSGLFIGGFWAAILCRRYLSLQRVMKWISVTAAVLIPMIIVVGIKYWDMMIGRFSEGGGGGSMGDVSELSSGRTDIWAEGLGRMMEHSWSFVTGFGWNSWSVMGFYYIPHNEYLSFLFELGLVGVVCFIWLVRRTFGAAAAAAAVADDPRARSYMVACMFSVPILSVAVIFAILFIPWYFIWPYIGLSMRYASIIIERSKREVSAVRTGNVVSPLLARTNQELGSPAVTRGHPVS
jgi:hypothetical protein